MYVGRRHVAKVEIQQVLAFVCKHCQYRSDALVSATGRGTGRSPFFLDEAGASERAAERAEADARGNLLETLALASCPKCGRRDGGAHAWSIFKALHAGVVIAEHDRAALERLCRYGARPAFAHERLAWTEDGRIAYRLKRPWPDGRTELVLPPVAFLRRLCGIIPLPRRHLVRFSGIFGPAAKDRAKLRALVPAAEAAEPDCAATAPRRRGRVPWAELLRRVFADDVLQCPCGGRRGVLAVVTDPAIARTLLVALDLPHLAAAFAPARAPPQVELAWDNPASRARAPAPGHPRPRSAQVCPHADRTSAPSQPPRVQVTRFRPGDQPARAFGRRKRRLSVLRAVEIELCYPETWELAARRLGWSCWSSRAATTIASSRSARSIRTAARAPRARPSRARAGRAR